MITFTDGPATRRQGMLLGRAPVFLLRLCDAASAVPGAAPVRRIGRRLSDVCVEIRWGLHYRFPWCCQAHFYLDVVRGLAPAFRRGGIAYGPGDSYVPCALCRRRPWRWRPPKMLDGALDPPRYTTWVQSCSEAGIPAEKALSYGDRWGCRA